MPTFLPKVTYFIDSQGCVCNGLPQPHRLYKVLNNASHDRTVPQTCLEPDRLLGISLTSSAHRVLIYRVCAYQFLGSGSQALSSTTEQIRNRHFKTTTQQQQRLVPVRYLVRAGLCPKYFSHVTH